MTQRNKIKTGRVILLLFLMPIIIPSYFIGVLFALVYVSAFCGFKNSEDYFMEALGKETTAQIVERMIKEKLK